MSNARTPKQYNFRLQNSDDNLMAELKLLANSKDLTLAQLIRRVLRAYAKRASVKAAK
jgi:hypothetical protein